LDQNQEENDALARQPIKTEQETDECGVVTHIARHGTTELDSSETDQAELDGELTTCMLKNIPYNYTIHELEAELASLGLQGLYDFIYLPGGQKKRPNLGYAFINFHTNNGLMLFFDIMHRYRFKNVQNKFNKPARVCLASTQGFAANIDKSCTSNPNQAVPKKCKHRAGLLLST